MRRRAASDPLMSVYMSAATAADETELTRRSRAESADNSRARASHREREREREVEVEAHTISAGQLPVDLKARRISAAAQFRRMVRAHRDRTNECGAREGEDERARDPFNYSRLHRRESAKFAVTGGGGAAMMACLNKISNWNC